MYNRQFERILREAEDILAEELSVEEGSTDYVELWYYVRVPGDYIEEYTGRVGRLKSKEEYLVVSVPEEDIKKYVSLLKKYAKKTYGTIADDDYEYDNKVIYGDEVYVIHEGDKKPVTYKYGSWHSLNIDVKKIDIRILDKLVPTQEEIAKRARLAASEKEAKIRRTDRFKKFYTEIYLLDPENFKSSYNSYYKVRDALDNNISSATAKSYLATARYLYKNDIDIEEWNGVFRKL